MTLAMSNKITNHADKKGTRPDPPWSTQANATIEYRNVAVKMPMPCQITRIATEPENQTG